MAPKKPKEPKLEFVPDHASKWQLYRSRKQFRATVISHPFRLGAEDYEAGTVVVFEDGEFRAVDPVFLDDYQPISNAERVK